MWTLLSSPPPTTGTRFRRFKPRRRAKTYIWKNPSATPSAKANCSLKLPETQTASFRSACNNAPARNNAGYRQLKKVQNSPPPAGVDYDFWLGPAPKREFNQNRYNGTYLYYWDYSGGMTITWGVHLIDTVMQFMNVKAPLSVTASGGKYVFDDDRDTPDTVEQVFDFPGFTLTYSCRHAS